MKTSSSPPQPQPQPSPWSSASAPLRDSSPRPFDPGRSPCVAVIDSLERAHLFPAVSLMAAEMDGERAELFFHTHTVTLRAEPGVLREIFTLLHGGNLSAVRRAGGLSLDVTPLQSGGGEAGEAGEESEEDAGSASGNGAPENADGTREESGP